MRCFFESGYYFAEAVCCRRPILPKRVVMIFVETRFVKYLTGVMLGNFLGVTRNRDSDGDNETYRCITLGCVT